MYGIITYNITKLSLASCPSQEEVQFFSRMHYIIHITHTYIYTHIKYNIYNPHFVLDAAWLAIMQACMINQHGLDCFQSLHRYAGWNRTSLNSSYSGNNSDCCGTGCPFLNTCLHRDLADWSEGPLDPKASTVHPVLVCKELTLTPCCSC